MSPIFARNGNESYKTLLFGNKFHPSYQDIVARTCHNFVSYTIKMDSKGENLGSKIANNMSYGMGHQEWCYKVECSGHG